MEEYITKNSVFNSVLLGVIAKVRIFNQLADNF